MRPLLAAGLLWAGGLALAVPSARAAASFEFLYSSGSVADDDQFLLHLAVGDYGYARQQIDPVLPRMGHIEEDLPVVLLLAAESGKSLEFIVDLRSEGLSWSVIFSQVGVSYSPLFVGIDRDPGPPYGKAWGHWKKNSGATTLSDKEIVGLANIQAGRRVTGVSAFDLARAQGQGKSVATVVAEKRGRARQAKGPGKADGAGQTVGSGKGVKSDPAGRSGRPGKGAKGK